MINCQHTDVCRHAVARVFLFALVIVLLMTSIWVFVLEPLFTTHETSAHDKFTDLALALLLSAITLGPTWILVNRLINRLNDHTKQIYHLMHQADASNQAKTRFLAACSHHLRTPLNAIQGHAFLLANTPPDDSEALSGYSANVLTGASRLEELVDKILTYADLKHASAASIEETDLLQLLSSVVEELSTQFNLTETKISFGLPDRAVSIIEAEAMTIAVREAVENALKHAGASKIRIEYMSTQTGYQITVFDNCKGIPEEIQNGLLSLFNVDSRDPHISGTGNLGIGFALIKRAVETSGGSLKVQSSPQDGTKLMLSYSLLEEANAPVVKNKMTSFARLTHHFSAFTAKASRAFHVFPIQTRSPKQLPGQEIFVSALPEVSNSNG